MEPAPKSSIDPEEVERFSRIAAEWWDPKGKFAPLHRFNPVRLAFIREQALARFARDPVSRRPFEGLRLLDIGCGGGLLSEPMSRLGFAVMGVDASPMGVVSTPPLTTVQFDPCAVADAALAAVFERLGHPAPPSPELTDIAHLVVRSST